MSFQPSKEAAERPKRTIDAAEVLHDHARDVAAVCAGAGPSEVVVAVVERDLRYGGAWAMPRDALAERLAVWDDGCWTLTFAPHARRDEIEERCLAMARQAFARWEALRRWTSRQG